MYLTLLCRYNPPAAMEKFKNAIASYQNSLKMNPKDEDAKYNLSYARKMLQQMQQQNQQQQQNDQQQQDNQQQDKNNKDNKDNNEQQNKDNSQQNQDQQQNQHPQESDKKQEQKKKDAERILDAVKNNEKKTLDKQKVKVRGGKIEKDW